MGIHFLVTVLPTTNRMIYLMLSVTFGCYRVVTGLLPALSRPRKEADCSAISHRATPLAALVACALLIADAMRHAGREMAMKRKD